jgi:ABC-type nitrate/sulfonate/bicarbonate transport system substrate-binding protein
MDVAKPATAQRLVRAYRVSAADSLNRQNARGRFNAQLKERGNDARP